MTGTSGVVGEERPRGGRPLATSRSELERVAYFLFDKHGFDETSIDDITAAAGIARRTFFRYYPSKFDLVWGDFDGELDRLRQWFGAAPPETPMMEAIHQAVLEFNRLPPGQETAHRRRRRLLAPAPRPHPRRAQPAGQFHPALRAVASRGGRLRRPAALPRTRRPAAQGDRLQ